MRVTTSSVLLRRLRRDVVELILDNHPQDCQTCMRNLTCELQRLALELGVWTRLFEGERKTSPVDVSGPVRRNAEKCILCGRCVRVCAEVQGVKNLFTPMDCGKGGDAPFQNFPGLENLEKRALFEKKQDTERFDRPMIRRGGQVRAASRPVFNDPQEV